jgi:hypothetical protein
MSNARDKANIPALNFSSTGIDDNATSTAITIQSDGDIGIGTTNPAFITGKGLEIQNSGTATLRLQDDGVHGFEIRASSTEAEFVSANAKPFTFDTGGSERMRINSDGKVLIGTTSEPQNFGTDRKSLTIKSSSSGNYAVLQISGNATSNDQIQGIVNFYNDTTSVSRIDSVRASSASDANLRFFTAPSSGGIAERMRIDSSGNVGIGTTSPQEKLDIDGNIAISGNTLFEEVTSTAGMPSSAGNKSVNTNYDSTFSLTAGKWLILVNASLQVFQTSGNESGLYLLNLSLGSSAGADNYGLIQKAVLKWGNGSNSYGDNAGGHFPTLTLGSTTTLHTRWYVAEYGTASNFWVRGNLTRIRCIRIG